MNLFITLMLLLVITWISPALSAIEKCLDVKPAKLDKTFRREFLSKTVHFPIGQKLRYGDGTEDHPIEFPVPKTGEIPKCFRIAFLSNSNSRYYSPTNPNLLVVHTVPFNCIRAEDGIIFCYLKNQKFRDQIPLTLWGKAVAVKTDNLSYILIVSCNSNKYPSWILLHRNVIIPKELKQEVLEFVETLGFNTKDIFDWEHPQNISMHSLEASPTCSKSWQPQLEL